MTIATPLNWDLDDVRFLFTILDEVVDMLGRSDAQSFEILWVNPVRNVLGELLGQSREGGANGEFEIYDFRNSFDVECGGGSIQKRYAAWVDEWELGKLCQWYDAPSNVLAGDSFLAHKLLTAARSLDELRTHCLEESGRYSTMAAELEARGWLATTAPKTTQYVPNQGRSGSTSQDEGLEGSLSLGSISALPVELLQQIFRLCGLPHHWVRAPLILSHVNSHFRSIALSTPSLWSSINDSLPTHIIELYVARSANEPLEILTRPHYLYNQSGGWATKWFEFMSDKASRIQRIAVVSNAPRLISMWGRQINRYNGGIMLRSVTKLALRSVSDTNGPAACPKWEDFPHLEELWIQGCWCTGWVGPEDPFPPTLQQLKLTKLTLVSLYTLLEALGGILGLVSLVMEDFALDPDHGNPSPSEYQVVLPALRALEFTKVPVGDMNVISLLVSTPNLSSLSVMPTAPSLGITDFLVPFTTTRPHISSLKITESKLEPQELKVVFPSLANLTQVHIRACNLTDGDLTLLQEPSVSPQLTVIVS